MRVVSKTQLRRPVMIIRRYRYDLRAPGLWTPQSAALDKCAGLTSKDSPRTARRLPRFGDWNRLLCNRWYEQGVFTRQGDFMRMPALLAAMLSLLGLVGSAHGQQGGLLFFEGDMVRG